METLPTTLLQIFCRTILNYKVIVKSIIDADDNFWRNSEVLNDSVVGSCICIQASVVVSINALLLVVSYRE